MADNKWVIKIQWRANQGGASGTEEIPITGKTTTKQVDRIVSQWKSKNTDKTCVGYKSVKKES